MHTLELRDPADSKTDRQTDSKTDGCNLSLTQREGEGREGGLRGRERGGRERGGRGEGEGKEGGAHMQHEWYGLHLDGRGLLVSHSGYVLQDVRGKVVAGTRTNVEWQEDHPEITWSNVLYFVPCFEVFKLSDSVRNV